MIFSRHQDPAAPVRVDGSYINLFNLRPQPAAPRRGRRSSSSSDNYILTGVHAPKPLCDVTRTPVGVDRRNMRTNLLTVDTGGNLYFEGIIDDGSRFTPRGELLVAGIGKPLQISRAGRFLVLRLANGDLFYLLWEGNIADYTVLGRLPAVPSFTVERVDESILPMYVDPVVFSKPVELVTGSTTLTEETVEEVSRAVTAAWQDTLRTARSTGRFVQPVNVRVALRLFDGSLYAMSDPVAVGSADTLAGYGRALLAPIISKGFIVGTEKSEGGVNTYRLGVTVNDIPARVWQTVIKKVEVYVSGEPEVLNGSTGTATYSEETPAVVARLGVRPRSEVMDSISATRMRLLMTEPVGSITAGVPFTVNHTSADAEDVETVTPPLAKADCMAGAGAFFHVCTAGVVSTMRRNNPFAVAASTDAGSEIYALEPLPAAGGAYTRSYLYLMTDSGITALTHDAQGRHANCRPIAPYMVENPGAVVHGGNGVWALSTCGMLMHLKGSAVEYVMSGLNPAFTLAWNQRHDELWILPGADAPRDHAMVLCSMERLGYTRRHDMDGTMVCRQGLLLQSTAMADGTLRITDLAATDTALLPGSFDKDMEVPAEVRSGRTARRRKEIGLCRFDVSALPAPDSEGNTLTVKYALPEGMQPQDTAAVAGAGQPVYTTLCETPVEHTCSDETVCTLVFRRPDVLRLLPDWQERYRLSGSGCFRRLTVA